MCLSAVSIGISEVSWLTWIESPLTVRTLHIVIVVDLVRYLICYLSYFLETGTSFLQFFHFLRHSNCLDKGFMLLTPLLVLLRLEVTKDSRFRWVITSLTPSLSVISWFIGYPKGWFNQNLSSKVSSFFAFFLIVFLKNRHIVYRFNLT